jgi:phenylpropionate dioxygenase-like ring-hydroxylating dioxygenase large terminal subunit
VSSLWLRRLVRQAGLQPWDNLAMIDVTGTVSAGLEQGYTLPAEWYGDAEIEQLERERIFARSWQYAGRVDQVTEPGDYFATTAGHIPIVVTRDQAGGLNALVNVCRHRGTQVAYGEGRRETLQCPYHAWTYRLDGKLHKAPRSEREPGFNKSEFSLVPVQVDVWGPFVFVNPDPTAGPLVEALGDLPAHVEHSGIDLDAVQFRQRREWVQEVNWKIALENYLECYHCSVAHPSFSKLIDVDPDSYNLRSSGLVSSQFGPVRESALNGKRRGIPYVPRGEVAQAQYHFLWPNTTVNIEPGAMNISIDRTLPGGLRRTIGTTDYFFGEGVSSETEQAMLDFSAQVANEDQALVEAVQCGLDSGMVPRGRLLLNSEHLIQHFQRLVYDALVD